MEAEAKIANAEKELKKIDVEKAAKEINSKRKKMLLLQYIK